MERGGQKEVQFQENRRTTDIGGVESRNQVDNGIWRGHKNQKTGSHLEKNKHPVEGGERVVCVIRALLVVGMWSRCSMFGL